jgi:hypothetical protein
MTRVYRKVVWTATIVCAVMLISSQIRKSRRPRTTRCGERPSPFPEVRSRKASGDRLAVEDTPGTYSPQSCPFFSSSIWYGDCPDEE